jgi:acetylornithine/N-succinyldiaminopimelate aminotransferase
MRELASAHGILLIADEIQTGMARTGTLLACEHEAVRPDILTLGKGLGGGLPLAALIARREVSCFAPGDQGGTFTGHPLNCAVGLAVLQALQAPGFLGRVRSAGDELAAGLRRFGSAHGATEVRGRGLLWALKLPAPEGRAVVTAAMQHGLLINSPRPELLRFMPALNVSSEEISTMLELLGRALSDVLGG